MSAALVERIYDTLSAIPLIDPHSHINPHAPTSRTLADILGYHYYTELAHSCGLSRDQIEEPGLDPREKVARLVPWLEQLDNTTQMSWFVALSQKFFGVEETRLTRSNWEAWYAAAERTLTQPKWEQQVLTASGLERVFLTNEFDDPLVGFDRERYIPCLRTDDLVFKLDQPAVRQRLMRATGIEPGDVELLAESIAKLFVHFKAHGARACAISLPPDFAPRSISGTIAGPLWNQLLQGEDLLPEQLRLLSQFVFWVIAQQCAEHKLPFDLMIGVNRQVYPAGVYQGQDLFDQRVSLIQYRELFNAFPDVLFPVSVLAMPSHHELVSYAWIFPNVLTHGHWWYANLPGYIAAETRSRLEALPRTKQIGYYSDMYKLEFGWPKFDMYRRVLAEELAREFVIGRRYSETDAVALGWQLLRGNVERVFGFPETRPPGV